MKKVKILSIAFAIIAMTFILAGCGNGNDDVAPERTPRPENGTTQETPAQPDIPETEEISNQRIVSNYNIRELNAQVPNTIAVSNRGIAAIRNDDTVALAGSRARDEIITWSNIKAVDFMGEDDQHLVVLFNDGTTAFTQADRSRRVENRSGDGLLGNLIAITRQNDVYIGLHSDGTIAGDRGRRTDEVISWTNIKAISASSMHWVGLRNDGTVVAALNSIHDDPTRLELHVNDWTDIIDISAGRFQTVGLREDGTVVAVGTWAGRRIEYEHADGILFHDGSDLKWVGDINDWRDIISIAAGGRFILGLRANGEVVITGYFSSDVESFLDVENWTDVIAIAASPRLIIGLRSDGTILSLSSVGINLDEWDMSELTNIRTVAN